MATERRRRETVFPGSNQWTGIFGSTSSTVSSADDLESSKATQNRRSKLQSFRLNLPVNPTGSYADQLVPVKEGSPWDYYRNAFGLELGGYVAIVCRTPATGDLYAMHSFSGSSREKKLYMLRQLKHENLLRPVEIFSFEGSFHVISEYTAISLEGIILVRPSEIQLAAIVHQILDAICYLESEELIHGSITCPNVLLTTTGLVKIANPESCSTTTPEDRLDDTKALGLIMSELMDESLEDGVTSVGSGGPTLRINKPSVWSSEALDFMTLTMTASASKLAEHPFIRDPVQANELVPLVGLALVSACRFYDLRNSYMHLRSSQ